MLYLLSTCGTSILTKSFPNKLGWLNQNGNKTKSEFAQEDIAVIEDMAKCAKSQLLDGDPSVWKQKSAELNSILEIKKVEDFKGVQHCLLHTDTFLGETTAAILKAVLEAHNESVQLKSVPGLRTSSLSEFRASLSDLTRDLFQEIPSWKARGYRVLFNLTGGFKSVNAYLQAFGSLYGDGCLFLFEGHGSEMMRIPRLPVAFDDVGTIRQHLNVFRRIKSGYVVTVDEAQGVPETLLFIVDKQVVTSVWGDILWENSKGKVLSTELLEPLSKRVEIAANMKRDFRSLQENKKVIVNETLDCFSSHLDNNRPMPDSHKFKPLMGNPVPPSTHEIYAWSDGGAYRLFIHEHGHQWIIDHIGPHL